jgi:hypothetical protein
MPIGVTDPLAAAGTLRLLTPRTSSSAFTRSVGVTTLRLMSNNPAKFAALQGYPTNGFRDDPGNIEQRIS